MEFIERDAVPLIATAESVQNVVDTVVGLVPEGKVPNWVVSTSHIAGSFSPEGFTSFLSHSWAITTAGAWAADSASP